MAPCAKCGREMNVVSLASFTLEECPSCLGIWFDLDELVKVTQLSREQLEVRFGPSSSSDPEISLDAPPAFCPRCSGPLEPRRFDRDLAVVMDVCPAGCGLWLDQGELLAIKEYLDRVDREAAGPYGEDDVLKIREKILQWQALHPEEVGPDDFGEKLKASYRTPYEGLARYIRRHPHGGIGGHF